MSSRSINRNANKELIIMIPITEDDEKQLDKGSLHIIKGDQEFVILPDKIICYGKIDFSNNSEDLDTISNMNWLDHLILRGVTVPSDYNYEEHSCCPPGKYIRYYDTTNPAVIVKYAHACLGKPERCCIFKQIK